jgi:hypothetical protein
MKTDVLLFELNELIDDIIEEKKEANKKGIKALEKYYDFWRNKIEKYETLGNFLKNYGSDDNELKIAKIMLLELDYVLLNSERFDTSYDNLSIEEIANMNFKGFLGNIKRGGD